MIFVGLITWVNTLDVRLVFDCLFGLILLLALYLFC